MTGRSEGTSRGMRRWWRSRAPCPRCKRTRPQNLYRSRLCHKCKKLSEKDLARVDSVPVQVVIIFMHGKEPRRSVLSQFYKGYLSQEPDGGYLFQDERYGHITLKGDEFQVVKLLGVSNE